MDAAQTSILLDRFAFLEELDAAARQALFADARAIQLDRGQTLYAAGERSEQVFLLAQGTLKVGVRGGRGESVLGYLHAGDIVGEAALDGDTLHDEEAVAVDASLVCALPAGRLRELMRRSPAIAVGLTQLVGRRLRAMHARVEQLGAGSAEARVAHALLALARELGTDVGGRVVIPLRLSQTELADLVGLRRETVNIVLRNLRQRGLFESQRHGMALQDLGSLAAMSS